MAVGGVATAAGSAKAIVATFAALIAAFGIVVAMVIFSIIPTFSQNRSDTGYGDQFICPAIMLKSLYTSSSSTFTNGTIADNPALSTLCTSAYKSTTSQSNVAGCVVSGMNGWGPYNTSTSSKRRRRATQAGLYSLGQAMVLYSTTCGVVSDRGKYASTSSSSCCMKQRFSAIKSFFTGSTGFVQWTPVTGAFSYLIVNASVSNYESLSVQSVYGIPASTATSLASSLSITSSSKTSQISLGCYYVGPLSQSQIAALIAAQYTVTTTAPSSTQAG
jgi:hypothetical protein